MVQVTNQGVLLVQGEDTVFEGCFDGCFPSLHQQRPTVGRGKPGIIQGILQTSHMIFTARSGHGGEAGVGHQAGAGGAVELFGGILAGFVVGFDGELFPKLPQSRFLIPGQDAVGEPFTHGLAPTLGDNGADAVVIYERSAGDDGQVVEQRTFVEIGLAGSGHHHLHHLLAASLVGGVAFLVAAAEEAGLLAAVSAVTHDRTLNRDY